MKKILILSFLILVIDQWSKIYVKTHFALFESVEVFSWFKITFLENLGMAFGLSYGGEWGKNLLTLFRIVMIGFIGVWLFQSAKKNQSNYFIIPMSFIFGGALGNLIDSVFYGFLFDSGSTFQNNYYQGISKLDYSGYSPLLQGAVVDMLQFPLFEFDFPSWLPIFGGQKFKFFEPIFNIADSAISIGVFFLILFNKKAFPKESKL